MNKEKSLRGHNNCLVPGHFVNLTKNTFCVLKRATLMGGGEPSLVPCSLTNLTVCPGNTKGGGIIVLLTSSLTSLESAV